jgi:hypothetical protein
LYGLLREVFPAFTGEYFEDLKDLFVYCSDLGMFQKLVIVVDVGTLED